MDWLEDRSFIPPDIGSAGPLIPLFRPRSGDPSRISQAIHKSQVLIPLVSPVLCWNLEWKLPGRREPEPRRKHQRSRALACACSLHPAMGAAFPATNAQHPVCGKPGHGICVAHQFPELTIFCPHVQFSKLRCSFSGFLFGLLFLNRTAAQLT